MCIAKKNFDGLARPILWKCSVIVKDDRPAQDSSLARYTYRFLLRLEICFRREDFPLSAALAIKYCGQPKRLPALASDSGSQTTLANEHRSNF